MCHRHRICDSLLSYAMLANIIGGITGQTRLSCGLAPKLFVGSAKYRACFVNSSSAFTDSLLSSAPHSTLATFYCRSQRHRVFVVPVILRHFLVSAPFRAGCTLNSRPIALPRQHATWFAARLLARRMALLGMRKEKQNIASSAY